jgi:hypothetical protein
MLKSEHLLDVQLVGSAMTVRGYPVDQDADFWDWWLHSIYQAKLKRNTDAL